jgi:4-hydroxy-tetrahydrodipicolinate reductase
MIKIALTGVNGRMGNSIVRLVKEQHGFDLSYAIISNDHLTEFISQNFKAYGNYDTIPKDIDVVIDFSHPNFSMQVLDYCNKHNKPMVIGTTGFDDEQLENIKLMANNIPVLYSSNMSMSVNILFKLANMLAKELADFEVEILESHHRYKKDAPSGTALKIGEVIANAKGLELKDIAKFNRYGIDCQREPNEIGFSVIRGGDIIGRHQLMFINDGETLSVTSEITNRDTFARGALLAVEFLVKQTKGFYSMLDVISDILN